MTSVTGNRRARLERTTSESSVLVDIDLDGSGQVEISTGVRFYDHMLTAFGVHGSFDLTVRSVGDVDIVSQLRLVNVPTLVLHVRDDQRVPFESGRQIAASIPGARLIALPGQNRILRDGEPAQTQLLTEIDNFLGG